MNFNVDLKLCVTGSAIYLRIDLAIYLIRYLNYLHLLLQLLNISLAAV